MHRIRYVSPSILLAALFSGCAKPSEPAPKTPSASPAKSASSTKLNVAAAANLKFALQTIEAAFEKQHSEIDLNIHYGSSGTFFAQITQKAPFDIFLSADTQYPAKLVEAGLAEKDSVFVYAIGRVVLWVPKSSALDVETLGMQAVLDPSVKKIAIANPKLAPYGQAAEDAMKKADVYEKVKDKIVLGENITQATQFVESGAADVGFLALSIAKAPELKDKGKFWEVPADSHSPIEQAGVILSTTKETDAARKLRAFLTGPEGKKILTDSGYATPDE
jgi:molybdate transport system substrate-binding protein